MYKRQHEHKSGVDRCHLNRFAELGPSSAGPEDSADNVSGVVAGRSLAAG